MSPDAHMRSFPQVPVRGLFAGRGASVPFGLAGGD